MTWREGNEDARRALVVGAVGSRAGACASVAGIPVTRKRRNSRPAGTIQTIHPPGAVVATSALPHQLTHSKK
jgi:hypothetical protein